MRGLQLLALLRACYSYSSVFPVKDPPLGNGRRSTSSVILSLSVNGICVRCMFVTTGVKNQRAGKWKRERTLKEEREREHVGGGGGP